MRTEGTEIFYYKSEDEPLEVVDVEGHNVLIYVSRSIDPDSSTQTLKPRLTISAEVPSITKVGSSDMRYDIIMKVLEFLRNRLGADYTIQYSNIGLELTPKAVEHIEREQNEKTALDAHPAFFESRDAFKQQILDCLDPAIARVRMLLNETRSNLALLSSEPPAPEAAVRIALDAVQSSQDAWCEEEGGEQEVDGKTHIVPSSFSGLLRVDKNSLPNGVSLDAVDHGIRTLCADRKWNMTVINRRESSDGCLFWMQSTPESYRKMQKELWGETQ